MLQPTRSYFDSQDLGGVTHVTLIDKNILHDVQIQETGDALWSLVDDQGKKRILLNFVNVEYMSERFWGKLISLQKKIEAAGGDLVMCNINANILQIFEITKLNKIFTIARDELTAFALF